MQPVRHILGALLFEQGEIEEAEAVYREDIKLWKDNMWGLLGLKLCLEARGDAPEELAQVTALFEERSSRADMVPSVTASVLKLMTSQVAAIEEFPKHSIGTLLFIKCRLNHPLRMVTPC